MIENKEVEAQVVDLRYRARCAQPGGELSRAFTKAADALEAQAGRIGELAHALHHVCAVANTTPRAAGMDMRFHNAVAFGLAALRGGAVPPVLKADDGPMQTMIREAVRFACWVAGEGICPVYDPATAPDEFLTAYSDATGDVDWDTLADRAALAPKAPS